MAMQSMIRAMEALKITYQADDSEVLFSTHHMYSHSLIIIIIGRASVYFDVKAFNVKWLEMSRRKAIVFQTCFKFELSYIHCLRPLVF